MEHSYILLTALFTTIVILGICCNTLTVITFLITKTLRHPLFIVNLALSDILFLSGAISFILDATLGYRYFDDAGCLAMGMAVTLGVYGSTAAMAWLAIGRFVAIVKTSWKRFIGYRTNVVLALSGWFYVGMFFIPFATGSARLAYLPNGHGCHFDWTYNVGYSLSIPIFLVFLPSLVMATCYFFVFKEFRRCRKKVDGNNRSANNSEAVKKEEKRIKQLQPEFQLALQLVIIYVVYNVCTLPYIIVFVFVDPRGTKLSGHALYTP